MKECSGKTLVLADIPMSAFQGRCFLLNASVFGFIQMSYQTPRFRNIWFRTFRLL
jgi:hypothetical protein